MTFSISCLKRKCATQRLRYLVLAALLSIVGACKPAPQASAPEPGIQLERAWVRQVPSEAKMTAAYVTIRNSGPETRQLIKVSSPAYESVSLHETQMADGVMRMRPATEIRIGAGETLELAPGGLHIMLGQRVAEYSDSESIALLFTFADGESIDVDAGVRPTAVD